jgi:N-acetylmuramoyl-L-alanine amidase
MRTINKHIIHCSASMHGNAKEIDRWHKERGFDCIGYHYVILRNGDIELGRPISKIGAHVKGHNTDSIGTCLIGDKGDFTPIQYRSLHILHTILKGVYPNITVHGHNEFDKNKTCPTFDVYYVLGLDNEKMV